MLSVILIMAPFIGCQELMSAPAYWKVGQACFMVYRVVLECFGNQIVKEFSSSIKNPNAVKLFWVWLSPCSVLFFNHVELYIWNIQVYSFECLSLFVLLGNPMTSFAIIIINSVSTYVSYSWIFWNIMARRKNISFVTFLNDMYLQVKEVYEYFQQEKNRFTFISNLTSTSAN